jgi:hypothetical protein
MITVLLITDYAEVVIRHYDTNSEDEAVRLFGSDWAQGRVTFESMKESGLFGPEWVKDSIDEALKHMTPQYQNGVRYIDRGGRGCLDRKQGFISGNLLLVHDHAAACFSGREL